VAAKADVKKNSVSAKDAAKKPAQQKAVSKEANKANKVVPAAAKKTSDAKSASSKPALKNSGQPVGQLAKNTKVIAKK
jgi:hypothetical protein